MNDDDATEPDATALPGSSGRGGAAASAGGGTAARGASGRGGVALEKSMLNITWRIPVLEQFPRVPVLEQFLRSQRFLPDGRQGLVLDTVEADHTK